MSRAELIIHPVRLRIVQTLLPERQMTVRELASVLTDVPQATLYRHLNELVSGEIIASVDERRVRGTAERVYALRRDRSVLTQDDLSGLSHDDHRRLFTTFIAGVLADFDRYLDRGVVDPETDGLGYRQSALHLTDEEFRDLVSKIAQLIVNAAGNEPAQGRVRRLLTTIVMPAPEPSNGAIDGDGSEHHTKE